MLPYEDREFEAELSKKYGIRGIPSLVLLDESGAILAGAFVPIAYYFSASP